MITRRRGYSLIETLVVMAIIAILMALYLPVLSKAMRKAEEVKVKEGLRQEQLGKMADNANAAFAYEPPAGRTEARAVYRKRIDDMWVTELLYVVENDDQFRAYWHTLINPNNSAPLQWGPSGHLLATDENNVAHFLIPLKAFPPHRAPVPRAWEFISTNLLETSSGTLGSNVIFTDGHVEYVRFPGLFPMTQKVAELSHEFVKLYGVE